MFKKKKYNEIWGIESLHKYTPGSTNYSYYPVYQAVNVLIELNNDTKGNLDFEIIEYGKERLNISVKGDPKAANELKNQFCIKCGDIFSIKEGKFAYVC